MSVCVLGCVHMCGGKGHAVRVCRFSERAGMHVGGQAGVCTFTSGHVYVYLPTSFQPSPLLSPLPYAGLQGVSLHLTPKPLRRPYPLPQPYSHRVYLILSPSLNPSQT
jgi:hypothetical protein